MPINTVLSVRYRPPLSQLCLLAISYRYRK